MIAYKILYLAIYFAIKDILYLAIKVNVPFYKQCSQAETRLICKRTIIPQNASIFFLALIFLYISEKKTWKNYVRFWKWNLKRTLQPVRNSFSRKSNLKFCIIFSIISFVNTQGSVKNRLHPQISSHILMVI